MRIDELKHYKTEDSRTVRLERDSEAIIDIIQTQCSEAVACAKKGNILYKGFTILDEYAFRIDPSKKARVSANTSNYYTLLMDNLPVWKDYPKRSRSLICSTNKSGANCFGTTYAIFPVNGSRIGICPKEDMWDILFVNKHSIDGMNEFYNDSGISDKSYEQFITSMFQKKDVLEQNFYPYCPSVSHDIMNTKSEAELISVLNKWYDPTRLKFKLTTTANIPSSKKTREVWTDGKSYALHTGYYFNVIANIVKWS